jgi:tRNA pseudouridine55 synthase
MQPQLSPFDGVLLIDKPAGMTSHDVVDRVRRHFGFKKVGHCGTLDPAATGLLILVLERATKLQDRLMSDDKAYEGTMILGVSTDSQDADGKIIAEKPVPSLTAEDIEEVLAKFRGDIQQIPPMVSAVKHQGTPLYKLARKGKTVEREPRLIHIYDFRVLALELPRITFRIACTKGTYVRTICSDIGDLLGCGAHLNGLRRTRSGKFDVSEAHQLKTVLTQTHEELKSLIIPILKFVGSSAA